MISLPLGKPRRILIVRADAIGDHVLAAGMLPHIRERFPQARIMLVCPDLVEDLFTACPSVDRVFAFNKRKLHKNPLYRLQVFARLKCFRADLVLNTVHSRDSASDLLARMGGGKIRIAHHGDMCNLKPERKALNDLHYTHLVNPGPKESNELDHHNRYLACLGIEAAVQPTVWIPEETEIWAEGFLRERGLEGSECLAFFPSAGQPIRSYEHYGEILTEFQKRHPAHILCLGSAHDRASAERLLAPLSSDQANLCGKTSLTQVAALLKRCRLAFGGETGIAHLATAVGTPQVVLIGGGHLGRFMPTSPLTTAVCMPISCYGCNWRCIHNQAHCIRDIPPNLALKALADTWRNPPREPWVYYPSNAPSVPFLAPLEPEQLALPPNARLIPVDPC